MPYYDDFDEDLTQDLDFTGVESPARASVPAGVYTAVVRDVELRSGRESGKAYLRVTFVLTDPEAEGTLIRTNLSFATTAKTWTKERLQVILGEEIPATIFPWPASRDRLIGRPVRIKVRPSEYDGVPTMDVTLILPPAAAAETTVGSSSPTREAREPNRLF